MKTKVALVLLMIFLLLGTIYYCTRPNLVGQFTQTPDLIKGDLEGKVVPIMFNQVWPFDSSQNIILDVIAKKQVDDYVIVVVDVKATANVQPIEPAVPKELPKEAVKPVIPTPRLPSKVKLVGRMKLTYEKIDHDWYLITLDNLTLKALPVD